MIKNQYKDDQESKSRRSKINTKTIKNQNQDEQKSIQRRAKINNLIGTINSTSHS